MFNNPLTWSDELAASTFLWLAMLGAVLALSHAQHMRMTALVQPVSPAGRARLEAIAIAIPALFLAILIRPAVSDGAATATEVSTIGIAYTVIAGLVVSRRFDWRQLYPALVETATLAGAILFIIGAATSMARALTQSNFSHALAAAMINAPGGKYGFLVISMAVFIILGSVPEGIPAMVPFGPLLFPAAKALGVHEVHDAMVIIPATGLGLLTPPIGLGYYAACSIGRVDPNAGLKRISRFLGALVIGLLFVVAFPILSTVFLPH